MTMRIVASGAMWRARASGLVVGLAAALCASSVLAQAAPTTELTQLDTIDGSTSESRFVGNSDQLSNFVTRRTNWSGAWGISGNGLFVVGGSTTRGGVSRAFRWSATTGYTNLGAIGDGGSASFASAVNFNGTVVVGHSEVAGPSGPWQAFRWTASGGIENLGTLIINNAGYSTALGVSDDGEVVVGASYSPGTSDRAFRWTRATGMVNLGLLPGATGGISDAYGVSGDGSIVVGLSNAGSTPFWRAFRWTQATGMVNLGTIGDADGPSAATGISADGTVIIGQSAAPGRVSHAFRWTQAQGMEDLGTIGLTTGSSIAHATNGNGTIIVGSSQTGADSPYRAFIWTNAAGMQDLGAILAAGGVNMTGVTLTNARGISRSGELIVGAAEFASLNGGTRPYVARILPSGGGGLTTAEAVQRSIDELAQSRTAQMITQMLVTSVHLGVNDQVSCKPRCGGAYASFGSFNASVHGRYNLTPEWTLLGGIGIGHSDEPGVDVEESVSLAASIRFDPANRGASRPFFEAGLGLAPNQQVRYQRSYQNGSGLSSGFGSTKSDFAQGYIRAGWVARLSRVSEFGGSLTLGQTVQRSKAYSEAAVTSNPFDAQFQEATDKATTASASVQFTRLVLRRLELNANVTVQHMLDHSTDLTGTVRGFGATTARSSPTTWVQPGFRIGWRVHPNWVIDTFANATIGQDGLETSVHGGFGITGRF